MSFFLSPFLPLCWLCHCLQLFDRNNWCQHFPQHFLSDLSSWQECISHFLHGRTPNTVQNGLANWVWLQTLNKRCTIKMEHKNVLLSSYMAYAKLQEFSDNWSDWHYVDCTNCIYGKPSMYFFTENHSDRHNSTKKPIFFRWGYLIECWDHGQQLGSSSGFFRVSSRIFTHRQILGRIRTRWFLGGWLSNHLVCMLPCEFSQEDPVGSIGASRMFS